MSIGKKKSGLKTEQSENMRDKMEKLLNNDKEIKKMWRKQEKKRKDVRNKIKMFLRLAY